jgi:hypothetical protein
MIDELFDEIEILPNVAAAQTQGMVRKTAIKAAGLGIEAALGRAHLVKVGNAGRFLPETVAR